MNSDKVKISVLMPVYNGALYLHEALDSVLNQTYKDFEIILINDGSTDLSEDVILSYNDDRIKYFKNATNLGVIKTQNKGLELCKGEYIARMDQDDICALNRFEKQVEFLDSNPDVAVCGTWFYTFDNKTGKRTKICPTVDYPQIIMDFMRTPQIGHPTVMMRKRILESEGYRYAENYTNVDDYKLFTIILLKHRIVNIPQFLLYYRLHDTNVSLVNRQKQFESAQIVKKEYVEALLGYQISQRNFNAIFLSEKVIDWKGFVCLTDELLLLWEKCGRSAIFFGYMQQLFLRKVYSLSVLKFARYVLLSRIFNTFEKRKRIKIICDLLKRKDGK